MIVWLTFFSCVCVQEGDVARLARIAKAGKENHSKWLCPKSDSAVSCCRSVFTSFTIWESMGSEGGGVTSPRLIRYLTQAPVPHTPGHSCQVFTPTRRMYWISTANS